MQTTTSHTTVGAELVRWLLFSVCLGLIPLVLRWLLPSLINQQAEFSDVLKDGELLLVGVGLAGAALSDVLASRRADAIGQFATFAGVTCLVIGSVAYGAINVSHNVGPDAVVRWSIVAFAACMAVGMAALIIKEAAK